MVSCSDTGMFLVVEGMYALLTEGVSAVGINLSLFRNTFFTVIF
jgi:hypothetical protein